MKTLWIGVAVSLASPLATAQTTIYKHVDENGRVTYTNRPMKGAIVLERTYSRGSAFALNASTASPTARGSGVTIAQVSGSA